ncbi:hypothetical protein JAAARDRAFT_664145 [Jaapia argillacea MUCL 33604]|uniref:Uncharacterized protein n=1 Tax=Jaapia argillacea MUCL 33604 TaxID=933084 RepID=A0A067Q6T1_9AGAM|nr:hypothetical protein JAAARDRAFT_664145 [Jaapia argillacea MUCL 33604]
MQQAWLPRAFFANGIIGWPGYRCIHWWDFRRCLHWTFELDESPDKFICIDNHVLAVDTTTRAKVSVHHISDLGVGVGGPTRNGSMIQKYDVFQIVSDYTHTLQSEGPDCPYLDFITLNGPQDIYRFFVASPSVTTDGVTDGSEAASLALLGNFPLGDKGLASHCADVRISSTFCSRDKALVIWYNYAKGICVALPTLSVSKGRYEDEGGEQTQSIQLWRDPGEDDYKKYFDWSPSLGRVVLLTPDGEVQIADFVPPALSECCLHS